jgi:hypothetical protein
MYCFSKFSFTQTRKTTYKPMNKILLTILFLCLLTATVSAQERTVSGKVTDVTDGSGLPGVNVVVQGTTKGTPLPTLMEITPLRWVRTKTR